MRLRRAREVLSRASRLAGPVSEDGLAELRARWRENLLTLIGLVWGSAAVVLLLAVGSGFYAFLDLGFKKTGDRYTGVVGEYTSSATGGARPGRRIQMERPDLDRVRASTPSASLVAAEIQHGAVALRTDFRTRTGTVSAATPDLQHIKVLKVARGRFYDEEDVRIGRRVAVLGANLPGIYFGAGDPLDPSNGTIQLEGTPFRVIGVLARKGQQIVVNNALHDDMLFVPLAAGQRALGHGRNIGQILVNPRRLEDIAMMHTEIRSVLWPRHHVAPDDDQAFRLQNISEFTQPIQKIAVGLTLLLGFVGTVTLGMAGVGVANLMIAIVHGRRAELAMRRACGARRSDLVLQLLIETLIVVLFGGLLGIAVALGILGLLGLVPIPDSIPVPQASASVLLTTFSVLTVTGLASAIVPAQLAARVDPASALRAP